LDKARKEYLKAFALGEGSIPADYYLRFFTLETKLGNYKSSAGYFTKFLDNTKQISSHIDGESILIGEILTRKIPYDLYPLEEYFAKTFKLDEKNPIPYQKLGLFYYTVPGKKDLSLKYLKKAYDLGYYEPHSLEPLVGLVTSIEEKEKILAMGIEKNRTELSFPFWEILIKLKKNNPDECKLLIAKFEKYFDTDIPLIQQTVNKYLSILGRPPKYKIIKEMAPAFFSGPSFQANYKRIIEKIVENRIAPVVMQYPSFPLEPLKEILRDFGEVIFISNTILDEMLKTHSYDELYFDHVAPQFGHLKPLAAKAVAENIIQALLQKKIIQE
jgi:hypothetical protein